MQKGTISLFNTIPRNSFLFAMWFVDRVYIGAELIATVLMTNEVSAGRRGLFLSFFSLSFLVRQTDVIVQSHYL